MSKKEENHSASHPPTHPPTYPMKTGQPLLDDASLGNLSSPLPPTSWRPTGGKGKKGTSSISSSSSSSLLASRTMADIVQIWDFGTSLPPTHPPTPPPTLLFFHLLPHSYAPTHTYYSLYHPPTHPPTHPPRLYFRWPPRHDRMALSHPPPPPPPPPPLLTHPPTHPGYTFAGRLGMTEWPCLTLFLRALEAAENSKVKLNPPTHPPTYPYVQAQYLINQNKPSRPPTQTIHPPIHQDRRPTPKESRAMSVLSELAQVSHSLPPTHPSTHPPTYLPILPTHLSFPTAAHRCPPPRADEYRNVHPPSSPTRPHPSPQPSHLVRAG